MIKQQERRAGRYLSAWLSGSWTARTTVMSALVLCLVVGCAPSHSSRSNRHQGDEASASAFHWSVKTALGEAYLSSDEESARGWLPYLSSAAAQVAQVWPHRQRSIPVRVFGSDADFETAVTNLDGQEVAATDASGILIAPSADRALKPQGKVEVLAHELTHWELGQYGINRAPLWVREGLAEWTAQRNIRLVKTALWPELTREPTKALPQSPPGDAAFNDNPALAYETAAAYVAYLHQYAGMAAVRDLAGMKGGTAGSYQQKAEKMLKPNAPSFRTWLRSALRG